MPETRRIENYGIMKLLPVERGSNNLLIQSDVIQLPYSEYLNYRTNPAKGHYGYACFMDGEYVMHVIDIQFRRQLLIDKDRYLVQLAWQEFCNSKTIAAQLGVPLPDTSVEYPIWNCKEIRFKLEPGVVLNVFKSHISPVTCSGTGIVEPDVGGVPPGLPAQPALPPPPGTPDEDKIPLSPPYEGVDDNGNTYKRSDPPPPPPVYPGPDCAKTYSWDWTATGTRANGTTQVFSGTGQTVGQIRGSETFYNPAFDSRAFRVIVADCSGAITYQNMVSSTAFASLVGSISNVTQVGN